MFILYCRNCVIKKGNVAIPYMAVATRTRSKSITKSENDKEFEDFIKSIVPSTKIDETSSDSDSMSSSSSSSTSSYYWSSESLDSVVPGSTSSSESESSDATIIYDVDNYNNDNNVF